MIKCEKIESVLIITLNRPNKYNAFIREMALDFQKKLDECFEDELVRAIMITGEGNAFCAGQDLNEAINPEGLQIEDIVMEHYNPIIQKIRNINKPVIAAVNGVAAGAGANIALACDVVVATKSAVFIQAFSKIGLIPDSGGTYFLPRLIGLQKAAGIMMTGEEITASKAESLGMIYAVYDDSEFKQESIKLALSISSMPTKALGYIKKLLSKTFKNSLEEQLNLEAEIQALAASTEDHQIGIDAFLKKCPPAFKGK